MGWWGSSGDFDVVDEIFYSRHRAGFDLSPDAESAVEARLRLGRDEAVDHVPSSAI
jgi:hypothetical protein